MVKGRKTKKQKQKTSHQRSNLKTDTTSEKEKLVTDIYLYPVEMVKKDLLKSFFLSLLAVLILVVLVFVSD